MQPENVNAAQLLATVLPATGIDPTKIDQALVETHIANAATMAKAIFSVPLDQTHIDLAATYAPQELTS